MNVHEVTEGKFVASLCLLAFLVIDAEMPSAEFIVAMLPNELVFSRRGRLMLAPGIPLVMNGFAFGDESLGMIEGSPVQSHSHD
jgi:hypothetical protein